MSLLKPYFRIARFSDSTLAVDGQLFPYVLDSRYCQERSSLCRAYKILQEDLENLFEYIEPCDANRAAYSHRTFGLMLRVATEFEANCKGLLLANGYSEKSINKWNIQDYWHINKATKLAEYKVLLRSWYPDPLQLQPFSEWQSSTYAPLSWYRAYTDAKHNRDINFSCSNFENIIQAIAELLCIVFSQFNIHSTHPYRSANLFDPGDASGMQGLEGSIFDIAPPRWSESESYDFDWSVLKDTPDPYEKFLF
jgi:hypothetical protein